MHKRKAKNRWRNTMTPGADTIPVEKEGRKRERQRGRMRRRQKEQRKYVVILNGLSVSFFRDTEIHLDLHQTTEAMVEDYVKPETMQYN